MRKLIAPVSLMLVLFIFGCSTAENKVPQMAADYCGCFRSMEDSLSPEAKQIIISASNASNTDTAILNATAGMSEEEKVGLGMEMMSFQSVQDPNSAIYKCMKGIEKKYESERTSDIKKFNEKLVRELESKKGCEITAAILKIGLKEKFK